MNQNLVIPLVIVITRIYELLIKTMHPVTTDLNPDSSTETIKNISSEQSDATLTLILVSQSNHDVENAKTPTLI